MTTADHVAAYLTATQGHLPQDRRDELATKMIAGGQVHGGSTVAEMWGALHLVLFGAPVGGGAIPTNADMAKLAADARADLEKTLGRPITADELATIAFAVRDQARAKGWKPARKPTLADQLDTVTLEDLVSAFPMTGDVSTFRNMTASKRAEYALIVLQRRTVDAMVKAAPGIEDLDGLLPEARLARLWA